MSKNEFIDISSYRKLSHQGKLKIMRNIVFKMLPYSFDSFTNEEKEKVKVIASLLYYDFESNTRYSVSKLFDEEYSFFYILNPYENSLKSLKRELTKIKKYKEKRRVNDASKKTYLKNSKNGKKMVSFWLDDEVKKAFHEELKKDKITMQYFLNSAIEKYLNKFD